MITTTLDEMMAYGSALLQLEEENALLAAMPAEEQPAFVMDSIPAMEAD